jgi:hypothetical protein
MLFDGHDLGGWHTSLQKGTGSEIQPPERCAFLIFRATFGRMAESIQSDVNPRKVLKGRQTQ